MKLRRRLHSGLAAAGAVVASTLLVAQQPAPTTVPGDATTAPLDSRIPADPAILVGELDNGLRYYVRHNERPDNRAELRLVVNAGSVLEDDDQRGLAHFVEHMAFNGTKNFPKLEIVTFMESIGMRFGPSVNAFTSFDETVYMLQVPTDRMEVLDRALLVLEDWAHQVSFDPAEIDKERGVIIEEWRGRRGASARLQDRQIPVLLEGSRYASRLPIGTTDVLQNFSHDRLLQFYKDWYRPDLMAVIAIGDFDANVVASRIRTRFAAIPRATSPKPRAVAEVPSRTSPAFIIATDPEQTMTQVQVANIMPTRDDSTVGSYRTTIVESLFASMLSTRFSEIAQKPDAPFLGAGAGRSGIVRTAEAMSLGAAVREDGAARGLEALFVEAERVARFGFSEAELERQKRNVMRNLERAVAEKDNQQSADLAAEYSRNFLAREPIPGIVYEFGLYERFLPGITLAELNALARTWSPDNNRVVMVTAPEKPGLAAPTEAELSAAIAAAAGKATAPYDEGAAAGGALLGAIPAPGSVTGTKTLDTVGITEWTLSNGARVVLKPTPFKQDEIVFRAFSPGGSSLAPDADFVPASTAAQVVAAGGVGEMSDIALRRALSGVRANVSPTIGPYEEGLSGGGSPKDLEALFQLIYLRFTQPRADTQLFDVMRDQTRAALANQTASPDFAFSEAINSVMSQDHPRARSMTPALVDAMNLDRSVAFYRDRFADASDFTFVFVGTFDVDTMRPLVERYIASLPSIRRDENWRDVGMRTPRGVVERRVESGIEPRSQSRLVFVGPFVYDQAHRTAIRAMTMVLQTRLHNVLREDLGGTYSVGVSASYSRIPQQEYRVTISFGSDPGRTQGLQSRVLEEIAAFKTNGPTERDVNDVREALIREFETGSTQNGYLLSQISGRYQNEESVEQFFGIADTYRTISAADIHEAARTYLDTNNFVRVTLMPAAR